jgi:hypothetical protein
MTKKVVLGFVTVTLTLAVAGCAGQFGMGSVKDRPASASDCDQGETASFVGLQLDDRGELSGPRPMGMCTPRHGT